MIPLASDGGNHWKVTEVLVMSLTMKSTGTVDSEGGREGGKEGGREGGREGEREGGRK